MWSWAPGTGAVRAQWELEAGDSRSMYSIGSCCVWDPQATGGTRGTTVGIP